MGGKDTRRCTALGMEVPYSIMCLLVLPHGTCTRPCHHVDRNTFLEAETLGQPNVNRVSGVLIKLRTRGTLLDFGTR